MTYAPPPGVIERERQYVRQQFIHGAISFYGCTLTAFVAFIEFLRHTGPY